VKEFARDIAVDVRKTWVVTEDVVTVQMAGRVGGLSATQSGSGTKYGPWDEKWMLRNWYALTGRWHLGETTDQKETARDQQGRRRRKNVVVMDDILF
jgi:hypothetical protein